MTDAECDALNRDCALAMGLVEGVDFGTWDEHDVREGWDDETRSSMVWCERCRRDGPPFNGPCIVPPPDYVRDPIARDHMWEWLFAFQIIEEVSIVSRRLGVFSCIVLYAVGGVGECVAGAGSTRGEAIARAVLAVAKVLKVGG